MRRPLLIAAAFVAMLAAVAAAAPDAATQQARVLFEKAQKQYALSNYEEALASYEKAFEAKPLPGLLFNIGQCHRQLGHYEKAASFFRDYLDKQPAAKNRVVVESLIDEMNHKVGEALAAKQAATIVVPPPPPPVAEPFVVPLVTPTTPVAPPAKTPVYKRWYVWTAVGVVALGGAGLGLGLGLSQPALPMGSLSSVDARDAH